MPAVQGATTVGFEVPQQSIRFWVARDSNHQMDVIWHDGDCQNRPLTKPGGFFKLVFQHIRLLEEQKDRWPREPLFRKFAQRPTPFVADRASRTAGQPVFLIVGMTAGSRAPSNNCSGTNAISG